MLNLVEFDRYMWREDRRPWRVAQPVNHLYQHFVSWGWVSFENSPLTFFCGSGAGGSTEAETESTIVFYFLLKGMLTCLWNNICRFIIHRKCFRAEWYAKSHLLRTSPNLNVLSVCGSIASASVCSVRPSVCLFVWLSVCLSVWILRLSRSLLAISFSLVFVIAYFNMISPYLWSTAACSDWNRHSISIHAERQLTSFLCNIQSLPTDPMATTEAILQKLSPGLHRVISKERVNETRNSVIHNSDKHSADIKEKYADRLLNNLLTG